LAGPGRLSPAAARASIGLALLMLGFAMLGAIYFDGAHRLAHRTAFGLVSLGNLLRGLGGLLPEERGAKLARWAVTPVALLMVAALAVTLMLQAGLR
jgi:hypothetical protein